MELNVEKGSRNKLAKKAKSDQQNFVYTPNESATLETLSGECSSVLSHGTITEQIILSGNPPESSYSTISPVRNTQNLYIHDIPTSDHMSSAEHLMSSARPSMLSLPASTNVTLATLTPLLSPGIVPTLSTSLTSLHQGGAPIDNLHVGDTVAEYHCHL
jgi:hypothetical protein